MGNDIWEDAETLPDGSIRIPSTDYKDGCYILPRIVQRNFRQFSPIENILYCLTNVSASEGDGNGIEIWQGGVRLNVEIPFLIAVLNPKNCPDTFLMNGIPDLVRLDGNRGTDINN